MRVAALYDIHGNLPALEAVLAEVEAAAPDLVVVGGDVVAGPLPGETLERLVALGRPRPLGDGQRRPHGHRGLRPRRPPGGPRGRDRPPRRLGRAAAHAARSATGWRRFEPLVRPRSTASTLCSLPRLTAQRHEILTAVSSEERLAPILDGVAEDVVVCGHTHHQFDRAVLGKRAAQRRQRRHALRGRARRLLAAASAPSPSCGAPTTTSRRRSSDARRRPAGASTS